MTYNLHTHSFYCGHGSGTIKEYADMAEEKDFDILGFSEHIPFMDGFLSKSRMPYGDYASYENDVKKEKERRPFPVLLGYEVDYFASRHGYYEEVKDRVDYLIAGTHYIFRSDGSIKGAFAPLDKEDMKYYAKQTLKALSSGLFSFFAHPDAYLSATPFDAEARAIAIDILDTAEDLGIPLEINGNGIAQGRGYPSPDFWRLAAERNIPAVISSDAHVVGNLDASLEKAHAFADEIGIKLLYPETLYPLTFRTEQGK